MKKIIILLFSFISATLFAMEAEDSIDQNQQSIVVAHKPAYVFDNNNPKIIKRDFIIETDHLWIRKIRPHDNVAAIVQGSNLPDNQKNELYPNYMFNHFEEHGYGIWLLEDKKIKKIIGYAGIIKISKEFFSKHKALIDITKADPQTEYAYEAANAIFNKVFKKNNIMRINMSVDPLNQDALNLAIKLGMKAKKMKINKIFFNVSYTGWQKKSSQQLIHEDETFDYPPLYPPYRPQEGYWNTALPDFDSGWWI